MSWARQGQKRRATTSDCNPLKINDIPREYMKYISENEIVAYNSALPSKDDIEGLLW